VLRYFVAVAVKKGFEVSKTRSSKEVLTNIDLHWQHAESAGGDLINVTPSSSSSSSSSSKPAPSFKRISDLMEDAIVAELVANDREAPSGKDADTDTGEPKRSTLGALGARVLRASKKDEEEDTSPKLPSFEETKARMDRVARLKSPHDDDDSEYEEVLGGGASEYIRNIVREYIHNEVENTVKTLIQSELNSFFRKQSNLLPAPAAKSKKAKKKVTARKAKKAASAKAKKAHPKK
jgi:hypothetical protein